MTVCMLLKRKSFMHKFMGHKKINHGLSLFEGGKVEKANKCGF